MEVNSKEYPNRNDEVMMDILIQMDIVSRTPGNTPGVFYNLNQAFEAGCHQADYQIILDNPHITNDRQASELFEKYTSLRFEQSDGTQLQPGDTIGIFDRTNYRMAYVAVLWPGHNLVYYTHTTIDEKVSNIRMHASELAMRSSRIFHGWTDGRNYDKAMLANLFGFAYDTINDHILIPKGMMKSSFVLAKELSEELNTACADVDKAA